MVGSDRSAEPEGEENNNTGGEAQAGGGVGGGGGGGAGGKSNSSCSQTSVFYSEKHSLKKSQPGDLTEEKQHEGTIYSRSVVTASIRSSSVRLLTPQMIEDDMKSRMSSSPSGLLTNYKTPHFTAVEDDDDVLSLYEVRQH